MFPLLDIPFNTILSDLLILLILDIICLSLVTAYHIYLPSVLLLLWNVFIIGGDISIGLSVFAYWISGTPDISWNWILCSLFVLLISLWLAFIILYSFFFFWWTEVLSFNADWPIFSFTASTLPLVYAVWPLSHLSWAGNSPGTKSALDSGYISLDSHFQT